MTSNAETAEAFLDRFLAGELPGALSHVHPEMVLDEPASLPCGGRYHGHAGYLEFVQALTTAVDVEVHGGKGTRTVASYDEDTTSIGVEAARRVLRALTPGAPRPTAPRAVPMDTN